MFQNNIDVVSNHWLRKMGSLMDFEFNSRSLFLRTKHTNANAYGIISCRDSFQNWTKPLQRHTIYFYINFSFFFINVFVIHLIDVWFEKRPLFKYVLLFMDWFCFVLDNFFFFFFGIHFNIDSVLLCYRCIVHYLFQIVLVDYDYSPNI